MRPISMFDSTSHSGKHAFALTIARNEARPADRLDVGAARAKYLMQ